jgi:hypothetical protein
MNKNIFTFSVFSLIFQTALPGLFAAEHGALAKISSPSTTASPITEASITDLKRFLAANLPVDRFDTAAFEQFTQPFLPGFSKLRKIEQYKTKNTALEQLAGIVGAAYVAFSNDIESCRKTFKNPSLGTVRLSERTTALAHYRSGASSIFETFQHMILALLKHKETSTSSVSALLSRGYGILPEYHMAAIMDTNGIVPFPLPPISLNILHLPAPYGSWTDGLQRTVISEQGSLVESPCIYAVSPTPSTLKFTLENTLGHWVSFPTTVRVSTKSAIATVMREAEVLQPEAGSETLHGLIKLPRDRAEETEFESAFLNELLDAARTGDIFAIKFLNHYCQNFSAPEVLIDAAPSKMESATKAATYQTEKPDLEGLTPATFASTETPRSEPDLTPEIQTVIHEQTERLIAASTESSLSHITTHSAGHGKKDKQKQRRAPAKPDATHAAKASSSTETEHLESARSALAEETKAALLNQLKTKGQEKWRTLNKVIIATLKAAHEKGILILKESGLREGIASSALAAGSPEALITLSVNVNGSHHNLHFTGLHSITAVKPHGKKEASIPAGKARALVSDLVDLLFAVSNE